MAIPAITSIVPSTSGQVTGSPTRTTDEAMASNGVPSMPSDAVTGGSARATETAAHVPAGPAITPRYASAIQSSAWLKSRCPAGSRTSARSHSRIVATDICQGSTSSGERRQR